jgi:hypothetical protein
MVEVFKIIYDDESLCSFYAKGIHTLQEMIEGIEWEEGDDFFEDVQKELLVAKHGYLRCVPVNKNDDKPFSHYLIPCKKSRGAFECTVVELD